MGPSKYEALSTDKLLALADSKYQNLLRDHWKDAKGREALDILIEFAGLKAPGPDNSNQLDLLLSAPSGDSTTSTAKAKILICYPSFHIVLICKTVVNDSNTTFTDGGSTSSVLYP